MSIVKSFNNHLMDFLDDIILIFPNDLQLRAGRIAIKSIKSLNATLLIRHWYDSIYLPYKTQIDQGDLTFFVEKDYTEDFDSTDDPGYFLKSIDRFRQPVKNMNENNKEKSFQYIQNLCQLSVLYKESKKLNN